MNIYEYYRPYHRFSKKDGRFGIEIETEVKSKSGYGNSLTQSDQTGDWKIEPESKYWLAVPDGSLRNFGMEFILREPLDLKDVKTSLDEFSKIFSGVPFLTDAPATSVHVHMNVQTLSARSLGNLVVLWTLFENILVEFSGEARRSNLFTLPLRCAEGNVKNFVRLFVNLEKKNKNALVFSEQEAKYAALNLSCLSRLGTLEVRSFRGGTTVDEIYEWVSILDRLYEYSLRKITPVNILDRLRENGLDLFFEVFGGHSDRLLSGINNPMAFIDRNTFYAAVVADCVDWETIDPVFEHKPEDLKKKKKSLKVPLSYISTPEFIQGIDNGNVFHDDDVGAWFFTDGSEEPLVIPPSIVSFQATPQAAAQLLQNDEPSPTPWGQPMTAAQILNETTGGLG